MVRIITTLALTLVFTATSLAQLKVNHSKSSMTIDGTSNVHDWTSAVEIINGNMNAEINGTQVESIQSLSLSIPVNSIKSGKSTMDKNTYKAMNADAHPTISYRLKSASINGNKATLEGTLTINGVSKTVKINVDCIASAGTVALKGAYALKMSDYKIEPPVAMMGAMKTGDGVKLNFNVLFTK